MNPFDTTHPFDTTLGTIRCETSQAIIDELLFGSGLRVEAAEARHHFDILDGGRVSEPEVALDLWELALIRLRAAEREGALPPFSVARSRSH